MTPEFQAELMALVGLCLNARFVADNYPLNKEWRKELVKRANRINALVAHNISDTDLCLTK